jgi:23S rRNA pseudouridine2605 synthase
MRLNKYLQQAGLGSRREAERWVEEGRVTVNGTVATVTTEVEEGAEVCVDGTPVTPSSAPQPRVFAFHKPTGVIVTARDHEGRETLYDALEKVPNFKTLPRLMPVGRLDLNSEGLLLLTDSGPLAQVLMSPTTALLRVYRVRVHGVLSDAQLKQWQKGLNIAGIYYRGADISLEKEGKSGHNRWYRIVLNEGKNREIRKIFEHFGCAVNRLQRTSYGPVELGNLPSRGLRELPEAEVTAWLKTLPSLKA